MLTSFADDEALFDAIMAGAAGYVLKQVRGADLVGAVRTVAAGGSLLDPHVTARRAAAAAPTPSEHDPLASLTDQERRILDLLAEGLTNRQIGERHVPRREDGEELRVQRCWPSSGMQRRTQAAVLVAEDRRTRPWRGPWSLVHPCAVADAGRVDHDDPGSEVLSREQCLDLLRGAAVGRLVFTSRALPVVRPVAFRLGPPGVLLHLPHGSGTAAAVAGAVVAFEAGEVDAVTLTGWTVTVTGQVQPAAPEAYGPGLDRLSCGLAVPLALVDGRRVGVAAPRLPALGAARP